MDVTKMGQECVGWIGVAEFGEKWKSVVCVAVSEEKVIFIL
jgi:hypothetical protein